MDAPLSQSAGDDPLSQEVSDGELVRKVLAGDAQAYGELVERHEPMLRKVARGILSDQGGVEDCLQEVFLIAYRKLASYRSEAPFGAWIYKIAVRETLRFRKKLRKRQALESSLDLANAQAAKPVLGSPQELLEEALGILENVPTRERAAFILHIAESKSYEEIAELLNCSSGTVGSLIHRARSAIGKILAARKRKEERDAKY